MGVKNKNIEDFYPLSPMQQGILYHSLAAPKSRLYFEQFSWNLHGSLNIRAFHQSWQHIVNRHSILQTCFVWEGLKEPVQVVHRQVTLPWQEYNWQHLSPDEQQQKLRVFLESDRSSGFELTQPPLMRLTLVQLSDTSYNFTWSHHHLLLDGWSSAIIVKEVFACYKAFSNGEDVFLEPIRPYRDYIVWLQQQNLSVAETYWRETLKGFTTPTRLWADPGARKSLTPEDDYAEQEIKFSAVTTTELESIAQQHQLTLNTLIQGAWVLLLSCYSGQEDIVFGAVASGRPPTLAKAESMVGLFINTLPIRVKVSPQEFLLPWLQKIQTQLVEARQYEYTPLVKIQGWSEVPKGLALFDNILAFENYPVDPSVQERDINFEIEDFHGFERTNYPVTLTVIPGKELLLKISYSYDDRDRSDTVTRMLGHLQTLLEGMVNNPQQRLCQLSLLTETERHQLLVEWNNTEVEYPQQQCIHELFETQVEKTPDAVAVVFENEQLTYRELNARANQLAHYLQKLGVEPEVLVGICVERSLEMVIGLLAILKAGGAYVPLDPNYPQERLAYMLADSQPVLLLTQKYLVEKISIYKTKVICIDSDWGLIADENTQNIVCKFTVDNLAYVIYTSGSTGQPKGVMLPHRAICNHMLWMQSEFPLTRTDKVLQKTPFSFDASVWEFYAPLLVGAQLVIARPGGHQDSNYLIQVIIEQQITILQLVPSLLQMLLAVGGIENCQSLKRVFCGGQTLPVAFQERFFAHLDAELHNLYGPTETCIDVTSWICQRGINQQVVPIGRPIANIQIYLLDQYLNPVAVSIPGEIYIGGVGVGRGYYLRPDLTAEKFIPNPYTNIAGERLYKTGDLARYLSNGEIEYIGRMDDQVKIRGFRIELKEIEAIIIQHPEVRQVVVVVRSDLGDSQRIVAYVVPEQEQTLIIPELRNFLESKLPNYMVPATFVTLETLPLTPNGKVDRKALPAPDTVRPELEKAFIAPQTIVEKQLAIIWRQVLGLAEIGINDNFFELGGDSILSLQIISKANQAGLHLTPKQLFQYQTIAQLANVAGTTEKISAEQNLVTGSLELTPIQHWFFEQEQPEPHHWNQAVMLEVKQHLNPVALEKILQTLQKHHDALRSRFIKEEFGFQAVVTGDHSVTSTYLDLSALPPEKQVAQMEAMSIQLQASLNLTEGPLFRVALFDLGANQSSRLLWVIHHLVVDGVSWRILIEDFQTAHQQICQNKAIQLPPKTTSVKQWSNYLQKYAQLPALGLELEYWLTIEQQLVKPIPLDFRYENNLEASACTLTVSLTEEETQVLLQQVPAVYQTQINDVLLTALVQTFSQWTGETSLLIDLEGHGREELFEDVDLSRTVGWFTTIFPVHLSLENTFDSPGKVLKSIKEQLRAIPNRGIGYGVLRYLSGDQEIRERFSRLPKAEVVFNYLGQFDQVLAQSSLLSFAQESSGPHHSLQSKRTYLLEINGGISQGHLQMNWNYSNQLHRQSTVETLAQIFIEALRSLITHCQSSDAGGFTPSDFSEFNQSQWDQTDLDAITADMGVKNKNIEDFYPLSPMQQGILYHSLAAPKSGTYFEQFSWNLHGSLNIRAFHQSWQHIVNRHSILQTCFVWEGLKEPVQVVHRQVTLPWQEYNWQHLSPDEQQQKLRVFLESDRSSGFELTQPPLMRLTLVQLSDTSYNFTWSHHHLLLDGWSSAIIVKEVFACYKAFSNGEDVFLEPIRPYRDYIVWLQQQNLSVAETYWRETLKGFTTPTRLWADPGARKSLTPEDDYAEQEIKFSAVTTTELESIAQQHQLTLNTLIQGAWVLLLSCYSGQEDIVFGAVASGRPPTLAKAESMVGLFINTLPIRVKVSPQEFLLPWLQKIQTQLVEARQYEYTPLVKIQGWSEVPKGLALFDNILVFENYPVDPSVQERDINFEIEKFHDFERTNYPVTLTVIPGKELLLKISYDDRDRSDTVTRMLGHLQTLLEGMVNNPQQRLCQLSLLTETERHQLLVEWNNTEVEYPQQQCIHQLFETQVEKTPDAVAVVFENEQLTYGELNARANQLAHYLQKLGVEPEVLVGICVERSLDMIIGLLAILKAGGAYIPLDPAYPQERLKFILEDTQAPVLLTHKKLVDKLPQCDIDVVYLDTNWWVISQEIENNLSSSLTSLNLAYVIYTSGSTGKPKGTMIPHQGLVNYLTWCKKSYPVIDGCGAPVNSSISFDATITSLFSPLIVGKKIVLLPTENEIEALNTVLRSNNDFSLIKITPAHLEIFNELLPNEEMADQTRALIIGGEALYGKNLSKWRTYAPNTKIINEYGPTETVVGCCVYEVSPETSLSGAIFIGNPIANTQLYILDRHLQPVPVGVSGELYIGGEGLARGYLNRSDLTAEKFIPNPFSFSNKLGTRLYKTGDLARYLPNGEIEYIGRIDNQVKIRGFRIELGEIEALITQYPAVRETVVVVRSDLVDSQTLVAYVVPQQEQKLRISELRSFLESKLPNYMVPAAVVILEALSLTPNGKIDRKALPAPELTQLSSSDYVPHTTPIENLLVGIWAEILKLDKVGIHDNFFELGGHSLIATRVMSQIRQVFSVELPLRCLFEKPTIAGLAKEIENAIQVGLGVERINIERITPLPHLPLSFAQQRLWFLAQLEPDSPFCNIPAAVRLQGELNLNALQQSFNEIVRRHEVLRTNFQTVAGKAVVVISEAKPLMLPTIDISKLPLDQQEVEIKQQTAQEVRQPFDISSDYLLRVKLLRLDEQEQILLLTMHHIISDGWSIGVFVQELSSLYTAFCAGKPASLPELPIQYVDFAVWQRQWLQGEVLQGQLAYWKKQLGSNLPVLQLPTIRPRSEVKTNSGKTFSFVISSQNSKALQALSRQEGVTLFMTLLAGFKVLLQRYTNQDDIVVGTDIANRNRAEVEPLIGFFVNLLVLRTYLGDNPSFRELLKQVRSCLLGAYAHQDLPFDELVKALKPERNLNNTSPLFQVLFVLQNTPMPPLELPGLTLHLLEVENKIAKFDLALFLTETEEEILGEWQYNADLFDEKIISCMTEHFKMLLNSIVAQPDTQINNLQMLTDSESKQQAMQKKERKAFKREKFMSVSPKSISLLPEKLIKIDHFQPGQTLPLVIQPNYDEINLVNWVQNNREFIEIELLKHGAILFRGFDVNSEFKFQSFAQAIYPDLFGEYGDLPRKVKGSKVYGSTPYPSDKAILFHNESSHSHQFPLKIWFCCLQPSEQGGETPIVDCRQAYQKLNPKLRDRLIEKQLLYVRHYTGDLDVSWQEFFQTDDKLAVENYCDQAKIDFKWYNNDSLVTRQIRPALAVHPKTGEKVFFNQIQLHHISYLDAKVRKSLLSLYKDEELPRNVYYGDGTPIEESVITEINEIYQQCTTSFSWQKRDVLMLDNMLAAHGRYPYLGQRKIMVAMGEMVQSENVLYVKEKE